MSATPTLSNLPSPSPAASASGPGTPMSGISTIAIKDGHEGSRPSTDGVDRVQRLMGYFDEQTRTAKMIDGMTYDEGVVDTTTEPAVVVEKAKAKGKGMGRGIGMAKREDGKREDGKREDETMGGTEMKTRS